MQSNDSTRSVHRSASTDTIVDDNTTETCVYKHCQVATWGTTIADAHFYMRSHMRSTATNSITGSHSGCESTLRHLDGNPFYLMEEYCGVTLGRDVERMMTVQAENVIMLLQVWLCTNN